MKMLGIGTSTMTTSVAVNQNDKTLGEVQVYDQISHSEHLIDLLETLLRVQNLKLGDLNLLVTGRDPGSFTGIRIGVTTIRTLAQILKKDAIGVSSLATLAGQFQGLVAPIVDARRGRVYTGFYQIENSQVSCPGKDCLVDLEDWIKDLPKETILCGEGLEVYRDRPAQEGFSLASQRDQSLRGPSLCLVRRQMTSRRQDLGYRQILPNYIRPSQAEEERQNGY